MQPPEFSRAQQNTEALTSREAAKKLFEALLMVATPEEVEAFLTDAFLTASIGRIRATDAIKTVVGMAYLNTGK